MSLRIADNKRRLLKQVKRMNQKLAEERKQEQAILHEEAATLQRQIDQLTQQVRDLAKYKEEAAGKLSRVKAKREALRAKLAEVQAEIDGTAEKARVADTLDKTSSEWKAAKEQRRKRFQSTARASFLQSGAEMSRAKHDAGWSREQPFKLLERPVRDVRDLLRPPRHTHPALNQFVPLGPSYPEDNVVEWSRFDHKPKVDWMVAAGPSLFSKLTPLGGDTTTSAKEKRLANAGPVVPEPPHKAAHPYPWRAPRSDGSRPFSIPTKDPQPGPMELAERAKADIMPRRLYKPELDGKEPWRPTEGQPKMLSSTLPDARYLHEQDGKRMEALLVKFGLQPGGTGEMQEEVDTDTPAVD